MNPTISQQILVDTPDSTAGTSQASAKPQQRGHELVGWVVDRIRRWEAHRNRGHQRIWSEYWRLWRGKWTEEDRNRQTERSRLIAPALAQAIDMTVSEVEEAIFGKEVWFDIADDVRDEEKIDATEARDQLLEDLEQVKVKDVISEAVLNAAIFGTGIVKINTTVGKSQKPRRNQETYQLEAEGQERVYVTVESIRPDEFIPDPSGKSVEEMLGVAHRVRKPLHSILEKIEAGTYRKDALGLLFSYNTQRGEEVDNTDPQAMIITADTDQVDIVEYHGKVPASWLNKAMEAASPLDEILEFDLELNPDNESGPMIEAIVTIANESVLLRAMANPFVMKDRSIIAFPFERVPGRFWGRGVAERGYNPQKALDAELRARQDALGFISAPMLGVDSGRVPRGFKMEIKPGKIWMTQGNPDEILRPILIGEINAATFNQADAMERMVQMGTGAFDTATALKSQSQSGANSAGSNSFLMGAFVKRAKRAIQSLDRNLLGPVIQKSMWRYMQFDPRRYPSDYDFVVKATLGIVAREVEAMQNTQLIGMMPEQFGSVSLTLVKGIVELSSSPNKAEIMKQIQAALAPPPPEVQAQQEELRQLQHEAAKATLQATLLENQKTIAEIQKLLSEAQLAAHKAGVEDDKIVLQVAQLQQAQQELEEFGMQNRLALRKISQQDRALDIKEKELEIKRTQANKPSSK